jgi:hypothetical protein
MENFKLDLSKLTLVAEKDRVKGNWYVVADEMDRYGIICQWHSCDVALSHHNPEIEGDTWNYWFAIPPNLPGFPVQELPDIIKLPLSEWAYSYNQDAILLHRKKYVETLVLPAGTIEERKKRLQEELDKLGK